MGWAMIIYTHNGNYTLPILTGFSIFEYNSLIEYKVDQYRKCKKCNNELNIDYIIYYD